MATDDVMDSATRDWTSRKEGPRRTIYFTKKLPGSANSYARTGQYLGDWKANQYDGKGTFESANGTRYVGDWVAGKREGSGTLWVKVKGELHKRYVGQWSENHPHGRGVYYYPNGDNYSGEWKKGVRHGAGTLQAKAGVYEGAFFNNKKHGFGVLDLPNGDHFEGMFVEDMKEGEGVYFYFDKDRKTHTKRYDGEWVDGMPKCGYYTEMPPDALVPASRLPEPLPPVELAAPELVISDRLAEIRRDRAHVRAERVPLDEHFTPEELEALRVAFGRVDVDETGEISLEELPRAFEQVGMETTDEELARLLEHLNKRNEPETTLTFAEFSQAADFLAPLEDQDDADPAYGF